ncbi:MAG: protein YgfX [Pseudomonadota bacterium]
MTHTIAIRPGVIGLRLIALMLLLACAAVVASGLPFWLQLVLIPGVLLLALYAWLNWPIHRRWKRMITRHDGFLQLQDVEGHHSIVEPAQQAFLSPFFVAFAVREADGRVFWIAGFSDQFGEGQYRALLTWMRFGS